MPKAPISNKRKRSGGILRNGSNAPCSNASVLNLPFLRFVLSISLYRKDDRISGAMMSHRGTSRLVVGPNFLVKFRAFSSSGSLLHLRPRGYLRGARNYRMPFAPIWSAHSVISCALRRYDDRDRERAYTAPARVLSPTDGLTLRFLIN